MAQSKEILPESKYGSILPGTRSFPGGNEAEFPDIREGLRSRGVVWHERELESSTVFWFYGTEVPKLPEAPEEIDPGNSYLNYLPVSEDSGHGISNLDSYLEKNPGEDLYCPKYGEYFLLGACECRQEFWGYVPYKAVRRRAPIRLTGECSCGLVVRAAVALRKIKTDGQVNWEVTVVSFQISPSRC